MQQSLLTKKKKKPIRLWPGLSSVLAIRNSALQLIGQPERLPYLTTPRTLIVVRYQLTTLLCFKQKKKFLILFFFFFLVCSKSAYTRIRPIRSFRIGGVLFCLKRYYYFFCVWGRTTQIHHIQRQWPVIKGLRPWYGRPIGGNILHA